MQPSISSRVQLFQHLMLLLRLVRLQVMHPDMGITKHTHSRSVQGPTRSRSNNITNLGSRRITLKGSTLRNQLKQGRPRITPISNMGKANIKLGHTTTINQVKVARTLLQMDMAHLNQLVQQLISIATTPPNPKLSVQ